MQQFKLESFSYTVTQGNVIAHFMSVDGKNIASDQEQSGDLGDAWTVTPIDIPGYTFKEVKDSKNTSGSYAVNDQDVTFIYTRNQGAADVKYVDDITGKTLTTEDLQGNTGDKSEYETADTIKAYQDKGYELVSDDFPTEGVTFTSDAQHYTVHLKHKTTPVNPGEPGEPGTPINPTDPDGPKWPNGTDKDSLTKTVNETIHYVYEDGSKAADDITDSSTFNHEIVIDNVTGEIVGDNGWTHADKDCFSQKNSPKISGYTASKEIVNEIDGLTQDSSDVEDTVVYVKSPVTPVNPTDPTNPVVPTTPTNPGLPGTNTTTANEINQVANNQVDKDSLSNTGMDATTILSIMGTMIAAFGSVGYYMVDRKKKNS